MSIANIKLFSASIFFVITLSACGGSSDNDQQSGGQGGNKFIVTASAGGGGSISPATQEVTSGQSTTFQIILTDGYEVESITGCGGTINGSTYTTAAITANCNVTANFRLKSYTVSTNTNVGGSVLPTGVTIAHGDTAQFQLRPEIGYEVESVAGCSGTRNNLLFETGPITADCSVNINFKAIGDGSVIGRYKDHHNGTLTDTETGLMWLRCSYGQTWQDGTCVGDATGMSGLGANLLEYHDGNYGDWRVPTLAELRSLVYCSSGVPDYWLGSDNLYMWGVTGALRCEGNFSSPTIVESAFPNTPTAEYPGFATSHGGNPYYFFVSFENGRIHQFNGFLYVRLVRDIK